MPTTTSSSNRNQSYHMTPEAFRAAGHAMIDWIADYLEHADRYPVRSRVEPGEVARSIKPEVPEHGEPWEHIWHDFESKIIPGITHWQSPSFHAYFPANGSYPAILGELLSAGLGINGMLWSTSPAATELETVVLDALIDLMDLPAHFKGAGVIQHTASDSSLCAILCGREQALDWSGNETGLADKGRLTVYTSTQAHSSIEKAAKIAGIGRDNVRVIETDDIFAMNADALAQQIDADLDQGFIPVAVCATMGTTSSLAFDPLRAIGIACRERNIWLHVDGAMAGTALVCPEFRDIADGLEFADSYCFNPHKWMFTNFDCDVMYVRDPDRLVHTLSIMPEYLRAQQDEHVINYRDWHIPLGRRFRALKLWFVLRHYGARGLRFHIAQHVHLASLFEEWVVRNDRFDLVTPRSLNLVCFRLREASDEMNQRLLNRINEAGNIHLTHTKLNDAFTLRMCIGQTNTREEHVHKAWREIQHHADALLTG